MSSNSADFVISFAFNHIELFQIQEEIDATMLISHGHATIEPMKNGERRARP